MYDVGAPLTAFEKTSGYTEGANFILEHFRKFSPKMANFAQMAFEKRWIEAEDRAGKRPGGFCISFTVSEKTRIFMTSSSSSSNIDSFALVCGYEYHNHSLT